MDSAAAAQLKRGRGQGETRPETGNGWEGVCCPSRFFLQPPSLRAQPHEEQLAKQKRGAAEAPAADCGGRGAERPKLAQPHPSGGAGGASLASDLGGMRAGGLSAPSKFFPFDKTGRVPSTFRGGLRGGGGKKTGGEGESVKEELSFHSNATQTQPGPWHSWKSRRSRKRAMSLH